MPEVMQPSDRLLQALPGASYRFHIAIIEGSRSEFPDARTLSHDPTQAWLKALKLNPGQTVLRVMEVGLTLLCEVPV